MKQRPLRNNVFFPSMVAQVRLFFWVVVFVGFPLLSFLRGLEYYPCGVSAGYVPFKVKTFCHDSSK